MRRSGVTNITRTAASGIHARLRLHSRPSRHVATMHGESRRTDPADAPKRPPRPCRVLDRQRQRDAERGAHAGPLAHRPQQRQRVVGAARPQGSAPRAAVAGRRAAPPRRDTPAHRRPVAALELTIAAFGGADPVAVVHLERRADRLSAAPSRRRRSAATTQRWRAATARPKTPSSTQRRRSGKPPASRQAARVKASDRANGRLGSNTPPKRRPYRRTSGVGLRASLGSA